MPAHGTAMFRVGLDPRRYELSPFVDGAADAARPFPGASAVVAAGSQTTATTTATNYGRLPARDVRSSLRGPSGWSVQPTSPTATEQIDGGQTFETRWTIGVPESASPGTYAFDATIDLSGSTTRRPRTGR